MKAYLLDTNIISDLVYDSRGRAGSRYRSLADGRVFTSVIVACELRYGVAKKASIRLSDQVEDVLGSIEIVPFEAPADVIYGAVRNRLEQSGRPIGHLDTLIAAHALALDATLVTANIREFERVEGLRVENWLA